MFSFTVTVTFTSRQKQEGREKAIYFRQIRKLFLLCRSCIYF